MKTELMVFLLTILLGGFSSALGFLLYKKGTAFIKYKEARFGGAVAIAGIAFLLMQNFYESQLERASEISQETLERISEAVIEYDTCIAHEQKAEGKACKYPADVLRDACQSLL